MNNCNLLDWNDEFDDNQYIPSPKYYMVENKTPTANYKHYLALSSDSESHMIEELNGVETVLEVVDMIDKKEGDTIKMGSFTH